MTYLGNWIFDHQDLTPQSPMTYDDWHKSCTKAQFCDAKEITIGIIDVFEELLDRHDITIPDDFRDGGEDEARIYGDTYYELEEKILGILKNFIGNSKNSEKLTLEKFLQGSEAMRRNAENR